MMQMMQNRPKPSRMRVVRPPIRSSRLEVTNKRINSINQLNIATKRHSIDPLVVVSDHMDTIFRLLPYVFNRRPSRSTRDRTEYASSYGRFKPTYYPYPWRPRNDDEAQRCARPSLKLYVYYYLKPYWIMCSGCTTTFERLRGCVRRFNSAKLQAAND